MREENTRKRGGGKRRLKQQQHHPQQQKHYYHHYRNKCVCVCVCVCVVFVCVCVCVCVCVVGWWGQGFCNSERMRFLAMWCMLHDFSLARRQRIWKYVLNWTVIAHMLVVVRQTIMMTMTWNDVCNITLHPSGQNTELKCCPFKACSRSVYSHTCYAYYQGFLPCLFLPSGPFTCIFSKPLSIFPVLAVANTWFLCRPAD